MDATGMERRVKIVEHNVYNISLSTDAKKGVTSFSQ
jgi:hypothetical protein